eukprot:6149252-Amphidinium_carterae.1
MSIVASTNSGHDLLQRFHDVLASICSLTRINQLGRALAPTFLRPVIAEEMYAGHVRQATCSR